MHRRERDPLLLGDGLEVEIVEVIRDHHREIVELDLWEQDLVQEPALRLDHVLLLRGWYLVSEIQQELRVGALDVVLLR